MNVSQQPKIDRDIAARCIVDATTILDPDYFMGGIGRVVTEMTRAIVLAGGRTIWIDGAANRIYELDRLTVMDLVEKNSVRQRKSGWINSLTESLRRKILLWRLRRRGRPFSPEEKDVLLLFGVYWNKTLPVLAALGKAGRGKVVTLLYDLIPVRRPELCGNTSEYLSRYREYLHTLASISDRVLTISDFTRRDFLRFCDEEGCKAPATRAVPLASDFDLRALARPTPRLEHANLADRPFALMVSTIEPRKNFQFAYALWRRVAEQLGPQTIPLILAGKRGWLMDDFLALLADDREMWTRHVFLIEDPSDDELGWLYSHAAFTLFPSQYEGWGLPITESLSFGTYCLAADNTSLREASQGLAWHGDTLDGRAWFEEVERCILDPAHLAAKRSAIADRFLKRRWSDFLGDVLREAKHAGEASN